MVDNFCNKDVLIMYFNNIFRYFIYSKNEVLIIPKTNFSYKMGTIIDINTFLSINNQTCKNIDQNIIDTLISRKIIIENSAPKIILEDLKITYVSFEITGRCNFRCPHCYNSSYRQLDDLPLTKIKSILSLLRKNGCLYIQFSGGEPLLRNDFDKIYEFAYDLGFLIKISSNLSCLSSKLVRIFVDKPPYKLSTSCYGSDKFTYENITTNKKSFAMFDKALCLLQKNNIPVFVKIIPLKQNEANIEHTINYIKSKGFHFHVFGLLNQFSIGHSVKDFQVCFQKLKNLKKYNSLPPSNYPKNKVCGAGIDYFHINPLGKVFICRTADNFFCDIFKEEFNTILKKMTEFRKQIFTPIEKCQQCLHYDLCTLCPVQKKFSLNLDELCKYQKVKG
jgi:radical SAM protein with 4Fe4S-binding SPASM domain